MMQQPSKRSKVVRPDQHMGSQMHMEEERGQGRLLKTFTRLDLFFFPKLDVIQPNQLVYLFDLQINWFI